MPKKVRKVQDNGSGIPQDIRSALRAFILSHKDGWGKDSLKDLKIYLQAYHGHKGSSKTIEKLLVEEMKSIGVEMKAMHIEEDLFSSTSGERKIKLGSCFCPDCGRFKNYKKECPQCGYHEMTV